MILDESIASYQETIRPNKMQEQAIEGIATVRKNGAQKALVISATGTGKTYL
ncbi:DEAD/DEAH box helicase family protein, partial [Streptococcus suis]